LPAGIYHVRVRAIDHEDFLGLAAARTISAVVASFSGVQGSLEQGRIRATHYSQLKIEAPEGLEVAEQGREFRACPCLLDLSVTEPNALRFRTPGGGRVTSLPIEYRPLAAQVSARFGTAALGEIDVEFSGFEGLSLDQLVRPRLRVHGAAGVQELPLTLRGKRGSVQVARADFSSPMRVDVVDAQGFLLGATDVHAPVPVRVLVDDQQVGPSAPFFSLSPWADVAPWSFAARPTGSLSLALAVEGGEARALNRFQVRDSFKGLGVDAGFSSPVLFGDQGGVADGAWLGLSFAAFRPRPTLRLGPAFRLGVPLEPGAAWRPELALGLELRRGRLGFSSDLGLRAASTHAGQGVPMEQAYLLVQGSFDVGAHALLYGTLDLHTLAFDDRAAGRAGLTLGAEIGSSVFVGAACRVSPWDSGGGYLSGQISLGVRGP
jgi:hypothetical protein